MCHVKSLCRRRATSFHRSTLNPAGGSVRGSTNGAVALVTTRKGGCARLVVVTARAESGKRFATTIRQHTTRWDADTRAVRNLVRVTIASNLSKRSPR